jgi:hypothetical protein
LIYYDVETVSIAMAKGLEEVVESFIRDVCFSGEAGESSFNFSAMKGAFWIYNTTRT